ncbi:hypothetical protein NM688_g3464 [Phlebia brevispora]|uniref:Uncharacterized protein n=1 Tax=Phlebia brevispora TaxID=194682 RepID=A0ACC1T5H9_9APHY|nr:hypothetical protein NM688_g3464 [Phlebia brevispora]
MIFATLFRRTPPTIFSSSTQFYLGSIDYLTRRINVLGGALRRLFSPYAITVRIRCTMISSHPKTATNCSPPSLSGASASSKLQSHDPYDYTPSSADGAICLLAHPPPFSVVIVARIVACEVLRSLSSPTGSPYEAPEHFDAFLKIAVSHYTQPGPVIRVSHCLPVVSSQTVLLALDWPSRTVYRLPSDAPSLAFAYLVSTAKKPPRTCTMGLAGYSPLWDRLQVIQTSESSSVNIEVPRSWRLWSGWSPRRWAMDDKEWKEWWDPMDDKDFGETTAFPALHPHETIFHVGLPDYTRNQRGWYHVTRWPSTTADGHERGTTGPDVPVELFDFFLDYMTCKKGKASAHDILMSKRELGLISLVCRRWAHTLRPLIFPTIILRSGEDAQTLLSFLNHPHSSIAHYIRMVILSQSLTQYPYKPWMHNVSLFSKIVGVLKSTAMVKVALCGPLPAGKFTKGVCEMLPRFTPWSFEGVGGLELKDLHFKKLGDLMRMPRDLPSLQWLQCSNVTWEDSSSEELPPTSRYLSRRALKGRGDWIPYILSGCTDDRAAIWFAVLLTLKWQDRLEQGDAHCICRIASALWLNDVGGASGASADRYEDCLRFKAPTGWVYVYFTDRVPQQPRRVRAIRLDATDCSERALECSDWEAIDRLAMALPFLRTFLIWSNSRDCLLLFHNKVVVQKMHNFRGSRKLKYGLQSLDKGGLCTRVSCSEDKVRDIDHPTLDIAELFD